VQRFTPMYTDAVRALRHATGDGGSSTRPTSRSPAGGGICTAPWTSTGRCCCPSSGLTITALLTLACALICHRRLVTT
jgi:hypothetical protein